MSAGSPGLPALHMDESEIAAVQGQLNGILA